VDNFESDAGWALRFGLVALDEKTRRRTMRPSGALFSAIALANALTSDMLLQFAPDALDPIIPGAEGGPSRP
jgi:hypothetical protein